MDIVKEIESKLQEFSEYEIICKNLSKIDAYVAGGFIRNSLLGKPVNDLDLFINSSLDSLSDYLIYLKTKGTLSYGPFGAPRWFSPSNDFYADIVPFSKFVINKKTYSNIEQILSDFDITINAIAFDINRKKIINPINGIQDLKNGIIRATHFKFPEITIYSSKVKISSLSVFWFRLLHYRSLLGFNFDKATLDWVKSNRNRYCDLENFKFIFFEPMVDSDVLDSIL